MPVIKKICEWLSSKQSNAIFAVLFAIFLIQDLANGRYFLALLDAVIVILNVVSFKQKVKGK